MMEIQWKIQQTNFKVMNYELVLAMHCFIKVLERYTYMDLDWANLKNIEA
jgi:hypothetical protein